MPRARRKRDDNLIQSAPALPGAHSLFSPAELLPVLDARLDDLPGPREIRAETVSFLNQMRAEAMAEIIAGFDRHPRAARHLQRVPGDAEAGHVGDRVDGR